VPQILVWRATLCRGGSAEINRGHGGRGAMLRRGPETGCGVVFISRYRCAILSAATGTRLKAALT